MQFAAKLEIMRIWRGLDQTDLADALKVSRSYICKMENGVRVPPAKQVELIRQTLGWTERHDAALEKLEEADGTIGESNND